MSNSFMSPLPTFTLQSLVTNGQWTAAQNRNSAKKAPVRNAPSKKTGPVADVNSAQAKSAR